MDLISTHFFHCLEGEKLGIPVAILTDGDDVGRTGKAFRHCR